MHGDRFLVKGTDVAVVPAIFTFPTDDDSIAPGPGDGDGKPGSDDDWSKDLLPRKRRAATYAQPKPKARPAVGASEQTTSGECIVAGIVEDTVHGGVEEQGEQDLLRGDSSGDEEFADFDSSVDGDEGESAAASSSSPVVPAPAAVVPTIDNVLETCWDVITKVKLYRRFPSFSDNNRWQLMRDGVPVSQIRPIGGHSIKCHCNRHRGCAMVINISGLFEEAQVCLLRWSIAGESTSMADGVHKEESLKQTAKWRDFCAVRS